METFLRETAARVVKDSVDLKDVVCILPSERAGIYFKEALKQELISKVSFLPKIISIEKFIKEISGFESIDQVSLVFEFFKIYQDTYVGTKPDTFERFIGWATVVIQDFNEIDRHLINPEEIFPYLLDIQKIKDWSPENNEVTPTIKNYMSFVKDLQSYYSKFSSFLVDKKIGYQGLIYKEAFKNHKEYLKQNLEKSFHFIGFNALNKAEEEIFKSFLEIDKNAIYWDVDAYYFKGKHEAGTFLRKFFDEWECLQKTNVSNFVKDNFSKKKNIQIVGTPLNVTGIKGATSFLNKEIDFKNTALVLAEEAILPVVLNSIPKEVNKVNITMGYSLNNIPLSGLFQSLFDLHLNKQKLGKYSFYYKDVISFFRHPYITKITQNKGFTITQHIVKNNIVFISANEIEELCITQQVDLRIIGLFLPFENIAVFLIRILEFVDYLNQQLQAIELLYVEGYRKVFQEIAILNTKYKYINSIKVLYKIFKKLLPLETVDFKGEALEGMQLMGVLETRCLDFKNVILTSVNEGILPSGTTERSFISFEVKKHFKMPTYLAKDAIFSYHFYRLLQRAENIYLLYNTQPNDFGGGEMSRFLTQLLIDKENEVTAINIITPIAKNNLVAKEIIKTPRVMELLFAYFKKGASPSRIIEYVNDPLDFYHKIVLKVKETDKVEEEVAHNTLGTVVHDSLEYLYKPYVNKILVKEDLKIMISKASEMVALQFKTHFKSGDTATGKNRLINEVANQFVLNFLNKELEDVKKGKEIVVKDLEREYKVSFTTPKGRAITLKGKIDRVDEVDGVRRIVDYKTGKVEDKDLKLSNLSLAVSDFKYHKIIQVMTYVLLYTKVHNFDIEKYALQTGIYSFKNFKAGFLAMNFSETRAKEYCVQKPNLDCFEDCLLTLIDEIFDKDISFIENLDKKYKKEA